MGGFPTCRARDVVSLTGEGVTRHAEPCPHTTVDRCRDLTLSVGDGGERDTLHQVADLAVATLPRCDVVGVRWVTVKGTRQVETVAATGEAALRADLLQYESGPGPPSLARHDVRRPQCVLDLLATAHDPTASRCSGSRGRRLPAHRQQ